MTIKIISLNLLFVCMTVSVRIPIRFDEVFGRPYIEDVLIPGIHRPLNDSGGRPDSRELASFRVSIHAGHLSQIGVVSGQYEVHHDQVTEIIPRLGDSLIMLDPAVRIYELPAASFEDLSNLIRIGVGPGSNFQGVSLMRNSTQGATNGVLTLGDDSTEFQNSCVPGTITYVPFFRHNPHAQFVSITSDISLVWPTRSSSPSYPAIERRISRSEELRTWMIPLHGISRVPPHMGNQIYSVIRDSGGVVDIDRRIVSNCDWDVLVNSGGGRLPQIVYTFPKSLSRSASIIIYPDDYLKRSRSPEQSNTCDLFLEILPAAVHAHMMDPFALPNVNVRIMQEEFAFCDSILQ